MEEADSLLSRGANHLWLDVQWYLHQALLKSGREHEAAIIQSRPERPALAPDGAGDAGL